MSAESTAAVEVVRSVSVPLSQARTFELFTTRMTDFWPKGIHRQLEIAQVVVEPHTGGRWFERGLDGSECQWGRVAAWRPPRGGAALAIGANWQFDPTSKPGRSDLHQKADGRTCGAGHAACNIRRRNFRCGRSSTTDSWTGALTRFAELAAS
jgi:hypothetical protein